MTTYEYMTLERSDHYDAALIVDRTHQDLLREWESGLPTWSHYERRDPMLFLNWLGKRGWRVGEVLVIPSKGTTWWLERVSATYCDSCATGIKTMAGLETIVP